MFNQKIKKALSITLLILFLFWLIEIATPNFSFFNTLRTTFLNILRVPLNYFSSIYIGFTKIGDIGRIEEIKKENFFLKEDNLKLTEQNEELLKKINMCSKWEETEKSFPRLNFIASGVKGFFNEGGRSYFLIDKGEKDGISQGKGVVWGNYLIGKITEVYPKQAIVETILSTKIAANVLISKSPEAKGIVKGYFNSGMILEGIPQGFSLNEGDLVLTSGLGGVLPPRLIVGKIVKKISSASEVHQKFLVRPLIDFENLDILFVIRD